MADAKKMVFNVDATQIDIKPILKKEFLELRMKAVSSANPNRNNSWFTQEALLKGAKTFKNKPILGYFEKNDFVSHNGEWNYDPETQMDYWDTWSGKGERILGFIRSEDDVEVVTDENGLSWICLSCALWVQYNFKQVKRLLKDAKKAKESGGTTKNISVEVNITDYEDLPNGVRKINDFELVGITILGSRNGVPVEPGIEGAELSVVDIMGNQYFEQQKKAIRVAYEKLGAPKDNNNKEVDTQMVVLNEKNKENHEELCPECGQNPCVCSKAAEEKQECGDEMSAKEETQKENESSDENKTDEKECNLASTADDDDDKFSNEEGKENEEKKDELTCEGKECESNENDDTVRQNNSTEGEGEMVKQDLAWMLVHLTDNSQCYISTLDYYKNYSEGEYKEFCIALLSKLYKRAQEDTLELTNGIAKITENNISDMDTEKEKEMSQYSFDQLYAKVSELEAENAKFAEIIDTYKKKEFIAEAKELINSVDSLSEDQKQDFEAKCEAGEISNVEDLKVKVALAATFTASSNKEVEAKKISENNEIYSAPVNTPNMSILSGKAEKSAKDNDVWSVINGYTCKD